MLKVFAKYSVVGLLEHEQRDVLERLTEVESVPTVAK